MWINDSFKRPDRETVNTISLSGLFLKNIKFKFRHFA